MSAKTGIQWTDATWNPVVGCTKVSQGCKHCYAKTVHDIRHKAHLEGKRVAAQYAAPFETVQLKPERLTYPLRWRKPRRIFVNSVSDLFHEDIPEFFIADVFAVMALAERHTFQILTKRPARMKDLLSTTAFWDEVIAAAERFYPRTGWSDDDGRSYEAWVSWINQTDIIELPNVWLGVSVENQAAANERIPLLIQTPAAVRWLSCEPLLGPIDFYEPGSLGAEDGDPFAFSALRGADGVEPPIPGIDWVVVGGESGKGARPFDLRWASGIQEQCRTARVQLFVKQLGAFVAHTEGSIAVKKLELRHSHGGDMAEWPEWLRVRQFPAVRA